jgi:heat shock protein HtpX
MPDTGSLDDGMQAPVLIYDRISANKRQTWLMMFVFVAVLGSFATVVALAVGLPWQAAPFVIAGLAAYALISYYVSSSVALAVSSARPVTKEQEPEYYRIVENLCIGSGLPMPKVYVIEDGAPNAFATGRDPKHASVTVTRGLLDKLDKAELEGVIAHGCRTSATTTSAS